MLIPGSALFAEKQFEWSFVLRNAHGKAASILKQAGKITFAFSATAIILAFQSQPVSYQDIASMLGKQSPNRWLMHIEQQPGETVLGSNLDELASYGIDPIVTGSLNKPVTASSQIKISEVVNGTPQPQKINRAVKGARVVSTTTRQAPVHFSAGSVLERHSMLQSLDRGDRLALAFVQPKSHKEALQVAASFHASEPDADINPDFPVMVASLVEESRSSILSYAPEPKVEYSPFSAVLVEEKPINIIPKLAKGDHAWAAEPLPKHSFPSNNKIASQEVFTLRRVVNRCGVRPPFPRLFSTV